MDRNNQNITEGVYPHFVTFSVVKGCPFFSKPDIAQIILDAFVFLQERREITLYGYVIMENHVHFIASGKQLPKELAQFKSFTARETIYYLTANSHTQKLQQLSTDQAINFSGYSYRVWQEGFKPEKITGEKMMIQKLKYMHKKPVKRGYVEKPEEWRYSSAKNYSEEEGVIPITLFAY